jgi:hypothetical protein
MWSMCLRPVGRATVSSRFGAEAGQERAVVVAALDEGVDGVAVGGDGGGDDAAVLIGGLRGLGHRARAALVVSSQAWRASSTSRAITRTPSPCLATCSAMGLPGRSEVVSTKRILPCCTT